MMSPPAAAIPFTTSFSVPSPPAETICSNPASTDSRAKFSISPGFSLMHSHAGCKAFKRSRIESMSFTAPAIGFRMTHVFIGSRDSFAVTGNEAIAPSCFALALNRHQLIDKAPAMPKENSAQKAGAYQISEGPVTSSARRGGIADAPGDASLPAHYGKPLLLAIARDPRSLFVCWSVDWTSAFANGVPADRRAHIRLRSN